jgi:oxygen-independent coproporphyrinogen-3 oxidase
VESALAAIRDAGIPQLNLDLIYGIDGQTPATWATSLDAALAWQPEELYLYPLYVRPLTGLGRRQSSTVDWDRLRLGLYHQGRDTLRAAGYRQLSMRHFQRTGVPAVSEYSCQDDGTVGLGCGSRSYTAGLHYSHDYAVSVRGVRAVLDEYLTRPDYGHAEYGFVLDEEERRRRWLVKTLLRTEGVDRRVWTQRFGDDLVGAFDLASLQDRGWLDADPGRVRLTDEGMAHSDAIGPWLVSDPVRSRMAEYELR